MKKLIIDLINYVGLWLGVIFLRPWHSVDPIGPRDPKFSSCIFKIEVTHS